MLGAVDLSGLQCYWLVRIGSFQSLWKSSIEGDGYYLEGTYKKLLFGTFRLCLKSDLAIDDEA